MASVFISYSRKDQDFVRTLYDALKAANRDAWVDWEGIPPTAEWLSEVYAAIDGADTFVFVLSPDSVASEVCGKEAAHAIESKKRIIPIVSRQVSAAEVKAVEPLAPLVALNWIFMRESDDFARGFEQLRFALDTDLDYWHLSGDLLVRAKKWADGTKNANLTLRGPELAAAERWLTQGADKEPRPTALQLDYITASRRTASRRQRRVTAGISVALVVTLVLSIVSFTQFERAQSELVAVLRANQATLARALAAQSSAELRDHHLDLAALLSAQAYRVDPTFVTRDSLASAVYEESHLMGVLWRQSPPPDTSGLPPRVWVQVEGFSESGRSVVTFDQASRVDTTDVTTGAKRAFTIPTGGTVIGVALNPDGTALASAAANGDTGVDLWDVRTGAQTAHLGTSDHVVSVLFSSDGTTLAAITDNYGPPADVTRTITLWSMATHQILRQWPTRDDVLLALNLERRILVASHCDPVGSGHSEACAGAVTTWDPTTSSVKGSSIPIPIASSSSNPIIAVNHDSSWVAIADDAGDIAVWDVLRHTQLAQLVGDTQAVLSLAFNPAEAILAAGKADGSIQLWDLATNKPLDQALWGHNGEVWSVAWAPDGQSLASGASDNALLLWSRWANMPRALTTIPSIYALSGDGARVLDDAYDPNRGVWDLQTEKLIAHVPQTASLLSPDGAVVVENEYSYDQATRTEQWAMTLADVASGKPISAPISGWNGLAYSADGRYIVVQGADRHVGIFDVARHSVTKTLGAVSDTAAMRPDDRQIAIVHSAPAGEQTTIELWDVARNARVGAAFGGTVGLISSLSFSPDGSMLTAGESAGGDQFENGETFSLWDLAAQPIAAYHVTLELPLSIAWGGISFTDDGRVLLVGNLKQGSDQYLRLVTLDGTPARWLERACAIAQRNLTHAEWTQFVGDSSIEPYQKTCPDLPAGQ